MNKTYTTKSMWKNMKEGSFGNKMELGTLLSREEELYR